MVGGFPDMALETFFEFWLLIQPAFEPVAVLMINEVGLRVAPELSEFFKIV